jgi:2'-5' RNA ligase
MNKSSPWIRAFIALNLPPEVKAGLERFQNKLKSSWRTDWFRWTPQEQTHLTLRFLGNIAADSVSDLESALQRACAGIPPFELAAEGFGCFPEGPHPRILWIGVTGKLDLLTSLVKGVGRETRPWGEREDKAFHPHLTIGRIKSSHPAELGKLSEEICRVKPPCLGKWLVTRVDLMQSELSPLGARHACIATVPLAGESAAAMP